MRKVKDQSGTYLLVFGSIVCAFLVGWVWNVIKIILSDFDLYSISGLMVLRVIGVFIFPLGGVLGYF